VIGCALTVYYCPVARCYSFTPCSIPALASHDDIGQRLFCDLDAALDALLAADPSWDSFGAAIWQALWARGDRPLSYDEHLMLLYGAAGPPAADDGPGRPLRGWRRITRRWRAWRHA
jgi:hypothetical protein